MQYFGPRSMKEENPSKMKKTAPSLLIIGLAALLLLAVFGWPFYGDVVVYYWHRKDFDAELWRSQKNISSEDTTWPPRLCMVDDLIKSGILDGLTKDRVIELLGSPLGKGFPLGARDCDIHYYLGLERGFLRIDSEWLFINFDEDDKVERYWIYRD